MAGKRKPGSKKHGRDQIAAERGEAESDDVQWQTVVVLAVAKAEGHDFLTPAQYLHVVDLAKQLVGFGARRFDSALTIAKLQEFWELKDKGGVLGRLNVRVYFKYEVDRNEIIVLSTYKKEDDGKAPSHILLRLRNRLRAYLNGELQEGRTIYEKKKWEFNDNLSPSANCSVAEVSRRVLTDDYNYEAKSARGPTLRALGLYKSITGTVKTRSKGRSRSTRIATKGEVLRRTQRDRENAGGNLASRVDATAAAEDGRADRGPSSWAIG